MYFMNRYEIEEYVHRTAYGSPVKHTAARFLKDFMDEVDSHSDGWCYWRAPVLAAVKLMQLVKTNDEVTSKQFRTALTPIKSFYTRKGTAAGMRFPEVQS
jgi:hypothetical protein